MAQHDGESWETLLSMAQRGDSAAGAQLVERLYPTVIRIVRNHLPFAMDEEDLAQEIFLKMFAKLDSFRGVQPLEHWVSRIARNTCYDHLRKQKRRGELRYADLREEETELLESVLARPAEPETMLDSTEGVHGLLNRLLASLKPMEEKVLRLLDLEQLSVKDIAAQLGWGESKVKVTAFRARKKLQATLKVWEPEASHED